MAAPWPLPTRALLLVASLCFFLPLSHGRILVPGLALPSAKVYGSQPPRNSHLNGVSVSDSAPGLEESSLSSVKLHGSQPEPHSHLNGIFVSDCTPPLKGDDTSSSPGVGKIVRSRTGHTDSHRQSGDHSVSTFQGKKWRRMLGKIAEWMLHACVVLVAAFAIFYSVSCVCACCIGLDLLAEIWRSLGGCQALRALLSYFVSTEKAVVEGDAGPLLA